MVNMQQTCCNWTCWVKVNEPLEGKLTKFIHRQATSSLSNACARSWMNQAHINLWIANPPKENLNLLLHRCVESCKSCMISVFQGITKTHSWVCCISWSNQIDGQGGFANMSLSGPPISCWRIERFFVVFSYLTSFNQSGWNRIEAMMGAKEQWLGRCKIWSKIKNSHSSRWWRLNAIDCFHICIYSGLLISSMNSRSKKKRISHTSKIRFSHCIESSSTKPWWKRGLHPHTCPVKHSGCMGINQG